MSLRASNRAISVGWLFLMCVLCCMVFSCSDKKPTPPETHGEWVPQNTGLEELTVEFLAIHPVDSDILFAGTFDGLFKSTNGAETWARSDSGLGNTWVVAIAFDALTPEIMYAGTKGGI